jgi:hypothetical protein
MSNRNPRRPLSGAPLDAQSAGRNQGMADRIGRGINRRAVMSFGLAASTLFSSSTAAAQQLDAKTDAAAKPIRPEPKRGARQDLQLVLAFVGAGHKNENIPRVKDYLDHDPKLVYASHDWGDGDWETALGGAGHTGSRDMARYLLSRGARVDAFCAAMLAQRDVVGALVAADPSVVTARGPHGYTLLYHVAIGGDIAIADFLKPHLGAQPHAYTQALSAAVRDGRLAMIRWLFQNGEVDPNEEDALGKRPLALAMDKGFQEVADELRKHGARVSE